MEVFTFYRYTDDASDVTFKDTTKIKKHVCLLIFNKFLKSIKINGNTQLL